MSTEIAGRLEGQHLGVDMLELGVAVRVAGAFAGLAVGLQAEAQTTQQPAHQLLAGAEALRSQRCSQMALALADPQQGRLRIAADRRLHQPVQSIQKSRLGLGRRLAAAARPTHPTLELPRTGPQIAQAAANRAARNPGCLPNRRDAAPARCLRFARRKQATPAFVQKRRKRIKTGFDRGGVDHIDRVACSPFSIIQGPRFVPCVLAASTILLFRFGYPSSDP